MIDPRDFNDDDALAKWLVVVAIVSAWAVALVKYLQYCQKGA